jgi:hypothetical protein
MPADGFALDGPSSRSATVAPYRVTEQRPPKRAAENGIGAGPLEHGSERIRQPLN